MRTGVWRGLVGCLVMLVVGVSGCGGKGPLVSFHDEPLNDTGTQGGGWDVEPSSLFKSGSCQLPSCDPDAGVDVSPAGSWRRILQTTGSSCGEIIKSTDDRAKTGARNEESETIPPLRGSCVYQDGKRVGTIRGGTMARCTSESRRQGVTSYTAEVVTLSERIATGRLRSYIRGIPKFAGGDCEINRDVRLERRE
jgi:hypothetical protein